MLCPVMSRPCVERDQYGNNIRDLERIECVSNLCSFWVDIPVKIWPGTSTSIGSPNIILESGCIKSLGPQILSDGTIHRRTI